MNLAHIVRVYGLSAVALLGLAAGGSRAADATPAPAPPAPAAEGATCETCNKEGCQTCSGDPAGRKPLLAGLHGSLLHGHGHTLHSPTLCPGACFGYFQTKWNRWEDVCGHYYQGINVSDAPRAPIPAIPGPATRPSTTVPGPTSPMPMPTPKPATGSPLPPPTTVIPVPSTTIPVPPVAPPVSPSKFAP